MSADGEVGIEAGGLEQESSSEKRYVKISKLSYETNSTLLAKVVSVNKVTEIIKVDLPLPFFCYCRYKIRLKSLLVVFQKEAFDCKLKKVKVPSNYFPTRRIGIDKRYYNNQETF